MKGKKDGTVELRSAMKTAFPQLGERAIDRSIRLMREKNERKGGA